MRTSFHHPPEAQPPNCQPTIGERQYPPSQKLIRLKKLVLFERDGRQLSRYHSRKPALANRSERENQCRIVESLPLWLGCIFSSVSTTIRRGSGTSLHHSPIRRHFRCP